MQNLPPCVSHVPPLKACTYPSLPVVVYATYGVQLSRATASDTPRLLPPAGFPATGAMLNPGLPKLDQAPAAERFMSVSELFWRTISVTVPSAHAPSSPSGTARAADERRA